ncbi:MAG: hypothetical protein K2L66_07715, partial [Paramuribaculum sp.]|nr:hypothetical protein [Paramuribaculum sp.]
FFWLHDTVEPIARIAAAAVKRSCFILQVTLKILVEVIKLVSNLRHAAGYLLKSVNRPFMIQRSPESPALHKFS